MQSTRHTNSYSELINTDHLYQCNINMDANASGFLLNPSTLHSVYYQQPREDDGIIDLGLSLRTLQPETYHQSGHFVCVEGYGETVDQWPQARPKEHSNPGYQRITTQDDFHEAEEQGVQSKDRSWPYVKVNMDGVIIGRKICLSDDGGYPILANQLEDMFGRQSESGLRLFQSGSEFCLLYKDREEIWRTVGDVPWRDFVECVRRLRISRKNKPQLSQ